MTSDVFAPLDPHGAILGDEVYAVLGEAILSGTLEPGERLRDVELAERLGVSRTPVREALQRLERCGLVEVAANRWTRVTIPDRSMRIATCEFITYTVGNAVRMALARCTDAVLDDLLLDLDALIAASALDDLAEIVDVIRHLASGFIRAADNPMMRRILAEQEFGLRRNLAGWMPHERDAARRTAVYRSFRDAVARRDADLAERILRTLYGAP